MNTIGLDIAYPVPAAAVMEAFWRAEHWPGLTEHVTGITFHYEDAQCQVLTMAVNSRGSHASFQTMRCRQRNRIYYFQPTPPAFLRMHGGYWEITPTEQGCKAVSHHEFVVNEDEARHFASTVLGWDGQGDVAERIGELLRANSRQTMEALRNALASAQAESAAVATDVA
ncbi:hypothetical protein LRH25_19935 [Ideonella azotifigens]|uniref:SRPBCC family protein n=1 Tax=Ideonella azotifigens TaxID=513160 RepID=A0ABP3V7B9_9BURK|nr:hypothetical protein [Ideonella azotifigens]MCD2342601.1 hypothetical protein [Ideonella azotifigens]